MHYELKQLEKNDPALLETYHELMYYFYICLNINRVRGSTNSLKTCVKYLFPVLDGILKDLQLLVEDAQIANMMVWSGHEDIVLDEDDGEYEKGDIFFSFHRQAGHPLSRKAMLAGYLSAWLKKCVIPSPPHNGITPLAIFPAIQ